MKKTMAVFVMAVFSLAAACAPAVPTPTQAPGPTPTPLEILATKPEHLEGLWLNPASEIQREGRYYLFGADGIIYGHTLEHAQEKTQPAARFWFEDGVYYEQCASESISYRVHLSIEQGRAARLRFEAMDVVPRECWVRGYEKLVMYVRVD